MLLTALLSSRRIVSNLPELASTSEVYTTSLAHSSFGGSYPNSSAFPGLVSQMMPADRHMTYVQTPRASTNVELVVLNLFSVT